MGNYDALIPEHS